MKNALAAIALLLSVSVVGCTPAFAQAQIDPSKPYVIAACFDRDDVNVLVERLSEHVTPLAVQGLHCKAILLPASDGNRQKFEVIMRFVDGDGDDIAIFEVPQNGGATAWLFVYYPDGFQPAGSSA